ncbi:unnamed protein product [Phytophthora fragariaefolia]|uniref:Unnamed protein product n=1 Tax=Phytophthora fragariaefolia TaxID=1490495 RepID=A0A9W6TM09_9STRA|nr:unnamed protein product [Phytophthora fragariaefolia]
MVGETHSYTRLKKIILVKPFSLIELMTFIGILLYMAVTDNGEYYNYWGVQVEDTIFGGNGVVLDKVTGRRRFKEYRKAVCFEYEARVACRSKYDKPRIAYNPMKPTGKYSDANLASLYFPVLYLDLTILTELTENLPVDTNMSTGSPNAAATHVAREDCPHLADPDWEALQRLATVIGDEAVATMLRTLSPTEQHGVTLGFIVKEQREIAARATVSTPSTPRVESLKHHVKSYVGRESEPLFRWLLCIVDPLSKVAFAMSCLGGRTRSWAYGHRLTDPTCLSTYEVFKEELRQAFEPHKMNLDRGLSSSICNKVSMTCILTLKKRGTWSRTSDQSDRRGGKGCHVHEETSRWACKDLSLPRVPSAAPSERHSHCKKKDDKPNLVILKVNSKRERSLPALVDCGASNNFVRLQSLARLDFEEVKLPRSLLEVSLATGVVVRTEKHVVRACFSYEEKKFVDELIVLDLEDKSDMVLGMPWLAWHDPVTDWGQRTTAHFGARRDRETRCMRPPSRGSARRCCLRSFRANTDD